MGALRSPLRKLLMMTVTQLRQSKHLGFFAILLSCLLLSPANFAATKEPITLTIWTSNENVQQAILNAGANFEKDYGAKIKVDVLSKDLTTQFKTAALSSKGPDIFSWAQDVIGELVESGFVEPLDLSVQFKQQFLPQAIDAFTYKGKIYGYPYDVEAVAMIYNKKLLPTPVADLNEIAALHKKFLNEGKGNRAFLYNIKDFFFSFPVLMAQGGYIFKNEQGVLNLKDVGLDQPGVIAGMDFIKKLTTDEIVPSSTDYGVANNQMTSGKLAMTINGPWALNELRSNKIDYGIVPIPPLNGKKSTPFVGSHGFIVRRSSPYKELAKEFIENYLVSKEGIIKLYEKDPRGPSRQDALDELTKTMPDLAPFMLSAAQGVPMPNVAAMGAVWSSMGTALHRAIEEKKSGQEALQGAKKQILTSLEESK